MLKFIINNQFVSIDNTDAIWQVIIGNGMGIGCSGDIWDLVLAVMAELDFVLDPVVQERFDISFYARFRDDIFMVIGGTAPTRRKFFEEFRRHTSFFKILVERISCDEVQMLDLHISFAERWQRCCLLDVGMHFKKTAQGVA